MKIEIYPQWERFLTDGPIRVCSLCSNTGIVLPRYVQLRNMTYEAMSTPQYCICPNGSALAAHFIAADILEGAK